MATKIYETGTLELLDGKTLYMTPLKLKYYREFMDVILEATKDNNRIDIDNGLTECGLICMKQYYPEIKTKEQLEDVADIQMIYEMMKFGGGVSLDRDSKEKEQSAKDTEERENSWQNIDLAKIESEVFLLGIYKDYEELELSLSLQELLSIVNMRRDLDYEEKKFLASIQGIDIEKGNKKSVDPWEAMKARVFSGGQTSDPNDITSFQGPKAAKAGFGVGMGIDYVDMR
ncbi:MAG: hypothetical protein ACOVLB_06875 [Candidatus Nanopelagicus sp.]